jgi:UPF0716 protein FxsA
LWLFEPEPGAPVPVLLIFFIAVPLLELALLILVGASIGVLPTLALVILTAVIGIALLQRQGYAALVRAREKMAQGRVPAEEMAGGVFLAFGGLLLLVPGFISDLIGLCFLIPGIRRVLLAQLLKRFVVVSGTGSPGRGEGQVIEGEYERESRRNLDR